MSDDRLLNCQRCSSIATFYVPEKDRVLCDTHMATFKEAYVSMNFSTVEVNDENVEAIKELLPKQSSELNTEVAEAPRVPVTLIVDHLAELATGVEPATCRICSKPMQLHSQFAPTKQVAAAIDDSDESGEAVSNFLRSPDYLANFAEGGRGVCLHCDGSGLTKIENPSDQKTIYRHFNDDRADQGHYRQLMDVMNRLRGVDADTAARGNLPFMVTRYQNLDVNPNYDSSKTSEFPFSIAGYKEFNFGENPHTTLHTLFHAMGQVDPILDVAHGHVARLGDQEVVSPLCQNCGGHGQHPMISDPDFADSLEEIYQKALEIPRDQQRRRKPVTTEDPKAAVVPTESGTAFSSKTSHSGPGIKPHDHHHKPHTYKKRDKGPGATSPAGSGGKKPGGGGGGGLSLMKMPAMPGGGGGLSLKFKKKPFSLPPVEKYIYDMMNALHDVSHTEYKTPSYMYRNPNPMYYSVPRQSWGDSRPWRN